MYDALLKKFVCRECPFKSDGCDFRATGLLSDANPCGGYILLSILIDGETVSGSDLEEACGG